MNLNLNTDQKSKIRHVGFRKKLYVFIICFILSSFTWILIKLSRDYTEVQKYPVIYSNIPAGKIIVSDPDSILTLKLKTKGFVILSNMIIFKPHIITIDVASMIRKNKKINKDYYIATSDLYQNIGNQIHYPNSVISIAPDTLYFRLEKLHSKKVPVRLKLNLNFARQYELSDTIKFDPDSVLVSGPKSIIDTIKFAETIYKNFSNLSGNQVFSIDYAKSYKLNKLTISPASVKVFIPVEKFTETTIDLTINIINNTGNYIVRTFPEKVKVTYLVSLNNFKNVNPAMFTAVADISKSLYAKSKKLKVEIVKFPQFVNIRKIEPEKIEYILLK